MGVTTTLMEYQMLAVFPFEAVTFVNREKDLVQPDGDLQFLNESFGCHCAIIREKTR